MDTTSKRTKARPIQTRRIPNFRLRSDPKKLLGAALEEFAQTSFKETRTSDIMRSLGLSKSALYIHFSSKRELFDRMIEEYCVAGELDAEDAGKALEHMLRSDPAAIVLRIVLREWLALPDIGAQYLDTVTDKLATRLTPDSPDASRSLVSAALAPVIMEIVFSTHRFDVSE